MNERREPKGKEGDMDVAAALDRERMSFFAKWIERELGIVFSEDNEFQLRSRLEDVAKSLGLTGGVAELYESAKGGVPAEARRLLLDFATNNETSFFRDPKVFRAIEEGVFKPFSEADLGRPIRIWSAASSSGQEATSVAILAEEFSARSGRPLGRIIVGTDVSERVLARASEGEYSQLEVDRGLSPEQLKRWFVPAANGRWKTSPALRAGLSFSRLNLLEPFPFAEPFDLVLCRNVLIYQNVERKAQIVARIAKVLAPGGFLFLGAGESLLGLSDQFERRTVEGVSLYRKQA